MRIKLEGDELLRVLTLTSHEIKILEGERVVDRVSWAEAYRIARDTECIGSGTRTRVKSLRIRFPRIAQWQPCWRTTQAAVLPPSADWIADRETRPCALL